MQISAIFGGAPVGGQRRAVITLSTEIKTYNSITGTWLNKLHRESQVVEELYRALKNYFDVCFRDTVMIPYKNRSSIFILINICLIYFIIKYKQVNLCDFARLPGRELPNKRPVCPWNQTLLIINYNHNLYHTRLLLASLYSPWFPNIVFFGPISDIPDSSGEVYFDLKYHF